MKSDHNLKAIIFDFDGVILESVDIKTEAFRKLFLDYPSKLETIIAYHTKHGGIGRFVKFEYIYREILKEPLSKEKSQELGRQFTENAFDGVVNAPFVKGSEEFLKDFKDKYSFFVASGTPQDEMESIVKKRNLGKYFKGVFGTPRTKYELTKHVLDTYGFKQNEVVFVGDAISDYDGAHAAGIKFIGRVHKGKENPFADIPNIYLINDLNDFRKIITTL